MNNTTFVLLENITQTELVDNYDTTGAIIFIIVVLLWYSISAVLLLGMQTAAPKDTVEDSVGHSRLFSKRFREKTSNKTILEELADKEKRDKLWDIYLGRSGDMNDRITRADQLRIENIQRRLATINEYYRDDNERLQFFNDENGVDTNIGSSAPDISATENRVRERRQSSADQRILQEWQSTLAGLRVNENWPWAVQRILIRRHLRRRRQIRQCHSIHKQAISTL